MSYDPRRKRVKSIRPSLMKEPSPGLFPSKQELPQLFFILAIASVIAIVCNYSFNFLHQPLKPFCSDGIPSSSISDLCEPCPKNGRCYSNQLECIHGYKKRGKACVEDSELYLRAKDMSDNIEKRICKGHAQVLCDGIGQSWFQEAELLKELGENKLKDNDRLHGDMYNFSAQKAVETLRNSLEMRQMKDGIVELKCPDRLVEKYKPLICRFRQWIYEHLFLILAVILGLTCLLRYIWRVRQHRYLICRAEELYEQVCEILEEKAMMTKKGSSDEPWVVASRLRDHLLLRKERKMITLWKKVEEFIQEDSRVDQYPKLVKGEQKVVWEWQVEGSLSSKLKSKREADAKNLSEKNHDSPAPRQKLQIGQLPLYKRGSIVLGTVPDGSVRCCSLLIVNFFGLKVFPYLIVPSAEMLIPLADISSFVVDLLAFHFTEWGEPSSQNVGLTS